MKKYYLFNDDIIGDVFPQCHSFKNGLTEEEIEEYYSFQDYYYAPDETFPPTMPVLRGYKLAGRTKLTDFVSHAVSSLLLVSPKALSILEKFNLGAYKTIPTEIVKRGVPYEYYFLYIVSGLYKYLKFEEFEFPDVTAKTPQIIQFNSISEFQDWRAATLPISFRFPSPTKIVLKSGCPTDLDVFRIPAMNRGIYYFSERLKTELEKNNLTGFYFTNPTELIIK